MWSLIFHAELAPEPKILDISGIAAKTRGTTETLLIQFSLVQAGHRGARYKGAIYRWFVGMCEFAWMKSIVGLVSGTEGGAGEAPSPRSTFE